MEKGGWGRDKLKFVGQIPQMSDLLTDYHAVRDGGAGVIDLTSCGRILVSGSEAVMFLNGLITNDMKTIAEHHWMPAAFPNVQGRLIAAVRVIRLADQHGHPQFLLDTEAATHKAVLKTIERFTMAGDFHVTDITSETAMFSVQGNEAFAVGQQVLGTTFIDLARDGVVKTEFDAVEVTVIRASHTAEDGFDVIVDTAHATRILQAFVNASALPVGSETFETLRVEAGIGLYGQDMDETNVITEANLDDAVSFTKGCYIGQEIIARIKYRGHVAKKLTGLVLNHKATVDVGSKIKTMEGKEIGRITSSAFSPRLDRTIALGYVRYEHLAAGTNVLVGEDDIPGEVAELPLVRGSWYAEVGQSA
jgi:folate-binding protein YgfZ